MRNLPARSTSIKSLQEALCQYVEDIGVNESASVIGVSTDTMRRRTRGEQPWFFTEVLDLARTEAQQKHHPRICDALATALQGQIDHDFRPLRIPAELREVLRLVGRLTTNIADTLDDGKVDAAEAAALLDLFSSLDSMTAQLKQQLKSLVESEKNRGNHKAT